MSKSKRHRYFTEAQRRALQRAGLDVLKTNAVCGFPHEWADIVVQARKDGIFVYKCSMKRRYSLGDVIQLPLDASGRALVRAVREIRSGRKEITLGSIVLPALEEAKREREKLGP